MKELAWFESGESLIPAEMLEAEKRLGVKFPLDYAQMVASHSGASNPDECEFEFVDKGRRRVGNFGTLLGLREEWPDNIFDAVENLGEQLPKGVIPIIDTGSGDCVCLDYRGAVEPSIAYFMHERSGEDAIVTLNHSFAGFVDRLRQPAEE